MSGQKTATRRRFIEASTGATLASWFASVERGVASAAPERGERLLGTVPFMGEGAFPLDTTIGVGLGRRRVMDLSVLAPEALVTAKDRFFIRTGCPNRLPPVSRWKVRMHGLVGAPQEISVEALLREATDLGPHLLECAGNSRAAHFGLIGVARWRGVELARVLERVRLQPAATQVLVSGFDEHKTLDPDSVLGASWVFGLDEIREAGAFLATEMNGAPLGPDHGYPLRLVVPGWYACAAIKWVNEIALVDDAAAATDHMREYAGRTHQEPTGPRDQLLMEAGRRPEGPPLAKDFQPATIDPVAVPVRVEKWRAGNGKISYRIVGIFWGGLARAHALRIRLNPHLEFVPVEESRKFPGPTWTLWSHTFPSPSPGPYRIELALDDRAVRTRRLDMGYYARAIEITRD